MSSETGSAGGGDTVDAKGKGSGLIASRSPLHPEGSVSKVASFAEEDCYRMNHENRGVAVIINNRVFDRRTGMGERNGTDVDAASLYSIFRNQMGFERVVKHDNMSASEMYKVIKEAARLDYTDSDCFACAILTHGEEGEVYGTDQAIALDSLVEPFKHNVTLAGKPKLFFIQACRGTKLDSGTEFEVTDAGADSDEVYKPVLYKIPVEADFLMSYSVVPGYFSWRNSRNGSWFVQALVKEVKAHPEMELVRVLTKVNRRVAYEFESNASQLSMTGKSQIPCITSMLTKELYFGNK